MDTNTQAKPDWLTEEVINDLKNDLLICPNPYTDEDIKRLPLDGEIDIRRSNAKTAKEILSKYGLLEEQEDKPNDKA